MGEYGLYAGTEIKIGTCEDMYYLREDQAHLITPLSGNVDPVGDRNEIRFRFPFPDEDSIEPGQFDDHDRGVRVDDVAAPESLADEHYSVQFRAEHHGYNVCLPCPESGKVPDGLKVHRNGFRGATFIKQQRYHDGLLVPVLSCTCGMSWRLQTLEDAQPVHDALIRMAEAEEHRERISSDHWETEPNPKAGRFYREMAARVVAGYAVQV